MADILEHFAAARPGRGEEPCSCCRATGEHEDRSECDRCDGSGAMHRGDDAAMPWCPGRENDQPNPPKRRHWRQAVLPGGDLSHLHDPERPVEWVRTDALMKHREWHHGPGWSRSPEGQEMAPRHTPQEWDDMAGDVAAHGIREPIHLTWDPKSNYAYVTEGNSRLAWAAQAGHEAVPVTGHRHSWIPARRKYKLPGPSKGPEIYERHSRHIPAALRPSEFLPESYMWKPPPMEHEAGVEDYGIGHRPMQHGAPIHDLAGDAPDADFDQTSYLPGDYLTHRQYYTDSPTEGVRDDAEAIAQMRKVRGKPDTPVRIYRATHHSAPHEINTGDWVTLSRAYALKHAYAESGSDDPQARYVVHHALVPARHVRDAGSGGYREQGYWGPPVACCGHQKQAAGYRRMPLEDILNLRSGDYGGRVGDHLDDIREKLDNDEDGGDELRRRMGLGIQPGDLVVNRGRLDDGHRRVLVAHELGWDAMAVRSGTWTPRRLTEESSRKQAAVTLRMYAWGPGGAHTAADMYHGSDNPEPFERFDFSKRSLKHQDEEEYARSIGEESPETRWWNSRLGSHFTSEHPMAAEAARAHGDGHVYHVDVRMQHPKDYASEHDLAREGFQWARGHGYRGLISYHENGESDALQQHPQSQQIAEGFRRHLQSQGHDGITYGNEYEQPIGHRCAIIFHPDQARITSTHGAYKPCSETRECPECGHLVSKGETGCENCGHEWGQQHQAVLAEHPEYGPEPEYKFAPRDWPDEKRDAHNERMFETRRRWKAHIQRGLSLGHLTGEQAKAHGYYASGHATDNYGHSTWQPLPREMYHATTDLPSVREHGLKTREELSQIRGGHGLGGGEDDTISVTTDHQLGRGILRSLHEFHGVVNGKYTPRQMWEDAKAGKGASRPFHEDIAHYWDSKWKDGDELPRGLHNTIHAVQRDNTMGSSQEMIDKARGPGWRPARDDEGWMSGHKPPQKMHAWWEKEMDPDQRRENAADFYKHFAAHREHAGGAEDPMFFATDTRAFAAKDPSRFALLHVRPRPGAQGYPLGGMREWRTGTGDALEVHHYEQLHGGQVHTAVFRRIGSAHVGSVPWFRMATNPDEYRMQHEGPDPGEGEGLHEIGSGKIWPTDFRERPWEYQLGATEESMDKVHRSRDWPSRKVWAYRALPSPHREINTGDWVSTSARYARSEGRTSTNSDDDYPVVKFQARAEHLRNEGNSLDEWSYTGPRVNRGLVHFSGGKNHRGKGPRGGRTDAMCHEHEPEEMYSAYEAQNRERREKRRAERAERERTATAIPAAERTDSVRHMLDHYAPTDFGTWDEVRHNIVWEHPTVRAFVDDVRQNGVKRPIPVDYESSPPRVMNGHTRLLAAERAGLSEVPTRQHEGWMDPDDPDHLGRGPDDPGHWTNRDEWNQHEAVLPMPGLQNPHTGGSEWFHGTQASHEELGKGFYHPADVHPGAYEMPESEEGGHWNALLGTHFTADHDIAEEFARGEHSSGASERHGWDDEEPPEGVVHARLGLKNPKHYDSEHDMDHEAYEHEHAAGNHPDSHISGLGKHYSDDDEGDEDDERYEVEEMWPHAHRIAQDYGHDKIPASTYGHFHTPFAGHPMRTVWLNTHPDKWDIADRFKKRLQAQGHDGVTYGNEYEKSRYGKLGNRSAIAFDPGQIQITQHHLAGEDHEPEQPPRTGARARRKPLQPDQEECWKCGVRAGKSEFTRASPYAPVMGLAMECADADACRQRREEGSRTAVFTPTERIFGPTYGLDHRLFDEYEKLRPAVRDELMSRLGTVLGNALGPDWHLVTTAWLAGSQASRWTSPDLTGNGDLDVLVGISHSHARLAHPGLDKMTDEELEHRLNTVLRERFNAPGWHPPFDPDGTYDLTGYVIHTADIRAIKPYAAYNLSDDTWTVEPPDLPQWSAEQFPQGPALMQQARALIAEVRAILRLPEPFRRQEASRIWRYIHEGRAESFGPGGMGWQGTGNVLEKALDQASGALVGKLKQVIYGPGDGHPQALAQGMTTADAGASHA